MTELTLMPNNFFTVKLYDILVPIDPETAYFDSIFLIMDLVPLSLENLISKDSV